MSPHQTKICVACKQHCDDHHSRIPNISASGSKPALHVFSYFDDDGIPLMLTSPDVSSILSCLGSVVPVRFSVRFSVDGYCQSR